MLPWEKNIAPNQEDFMSIPAFMETRARPILKSLEEWLMTQLDIRPNGFSRARKIDDVRAKLDEALDQLMALEPQDSKPYSDKTHLQCCLGLIMEVLNRVIRKMAYDTSLGSSHFFYVQLLKTFVPPEWTIPSTSLWWTKPAEYQSSFHQP